MSQNILTAKACITCIIKAYTCKIKAFVFECQQERQTSQSERDEKDTGKTPISYVCCQSKDNMMLLFQLFSQDIRTGFLCCTLDKEVKDNTTLQVD
jgi:hypothetical protein